MLVGVYEFNTASREVIEIQPGKLSLQRPDNDSWQLITDGMDFNLPKNSSFKVEVLEIVNYTCSYFND